MTTTNPIRVYQEIKDSYLRYIDTAYWLRHKELMIERRKLLTETDLLFTDVLLEPVLPYDAQIDLAGVIGEAGVDPSRRRARGLRFVWCIYQAWRAVPAAFSPG